MKKNTWVYGKSPSPTNWHEAASILKDRKKPKKSSGFMDHLLEIKQMLKDKR